MLNIIHLPHRLDRMKLLFEELDSNNITEYKIWDGIIKNPAHLGIREAHQNVVLDAKEQGLKKVIIAEDDIHFTSNKSYQYFLDNEPDDYDIYLGCCYWCQIKDDHTVHEFASLILYMVHERFYDQFLNAPLTRKGKEILVQLDRSLVGLGRFIVCYPFAALQHETYSDNAKGFRNYSSFLKDKKLYTGEE